MSPLVWTAALVAVWCAASALAALLVGPALRRRAEARSVGPVSRSAARPGELDPLDTGPMRMWLAELPETPEPRRSSPSTLG